MSLLEEINTSRIGWPTPGPINQRDDGKRQAGIKFGNPADRPDRRIMWFESKEELLELLNVGSYMLRCWDELDQQDAVKAHPSSQPEQPAAAEPSPVRAAFEPVRSLQPVHPVSGSGATPVPPSAIALASPDRTSPRLARPYVVPQPEAGDAAVAEADPTPQVAER